MLIHTELFFDMSGLGLGLIHYGLGTGRAFEFLRGLLHSNLGQVIFTHVPRSSSSINWYRRNG